MKRAKLVKKDTAKCITSAFKTVSSISRHSTNSPAENIMRLQHSLGNQAVQQLFKSGGLQSGESGAYSLNRTAPSGIVMRSELLDQETQDTKQRLTFDTDRNTRDLNKYFGLSGTPVLANNVTADFSYAIDSIENLKDNKTKADLKQGLRLYALSTFDLMPDDKGVAHSKRLNLVHVENLNLTRWGGPDESFCFTCIGQTDSKNTINVRILIESSGLAWNYMSDDSTAPGIEKTAEKYGIRRDINNDPLATTRTSIPDNVWNKVLRSLGRIGEWILMRLRDITFTMSSQDKGPKGEDAEYKTETKNGVVTRKIILYSHLLSADDQEFAFTIQHEIGHALDSAPAETPSAIDNDKLSHNDPRFLEAVKADGGQNAAVTKYGKTDAFEFYAECFAMFISQPATLNAMRPNIYKYFNKYQWEALNDPKLNPYAPKPGEKRPMTGLGPIGPF